MCGKDSCQEVSEEAAAMLGRYRYFAPITLVTAISRWKFWDNLQQLKQVKKISTCVAKLHPERLIPETFHPRNFLCILLRGLRKACSKMVSMRCFTKFLESLIAWWYYRIPYKPVLRSRSHRKPHHVGGIRAGVITRCGSGSNCPSSDLDIQHR
jgi:hypothetical protein